jgi:hypothetical protein
MYCGGMNMCKRVGLVLVLAVLVIGSAVPAYAWRGHHGYHGHHGYRHGYRRPGVVIVPRVVVPFWGPYVYPPVVAAPPVYVQPAPQVYVQPPPPQPYWYYCDNPAGYYPYVAQCAGGWRQVPASPPR